MGQGYSGGHFVMLVQKFVQILTSVSIESVLYDGIDTFIPDVRTITIQDRSDGNTVNINSQSTTNLSQRFSFKDIGVV